MTLLDARRAPPGRRASSCSGSCPAPATAAPPAWSAAATARPASSRPCSTRCSSCVDGAAGHGELADGCSATAAARPSTAEDVRTCSTRSSRRSGCSPTPTAPRRRSRRPTPLLGLKLKVVVTDPAGPPASPRPSAGCSGRGSSCRCWSPSPSTSWWVLWEKGLAQATRQAFYEPGLLLAVFVLTVAVGRLPRARPRRRLPRRGRDGRARWAPGSTSCGRPSTPTSTTATGSAAGAG